jgi:hypothetical protein
MSRRLLCALALSFAAVAATAAERHVLFIGNSLTYFNEMPWITERVAESLNVAPPLRTQFSGGSGMTLRQHWDRGRAVRAIREGRFTHVVLQPQSSEIVRTPEETFRYAKLLHGEIKRSGAKTVLFWTWAPRTMNFTQRQFDAQYAKLARELGAIVAPVGIAWESLQSGGVELFDGSGLHPNLAGSYLAACVFVATIYQRSPEGARHVFDVKYDINEFYREALETERLTAEAARRIQRAAWAAVQRR